MSFFTVVAILITGAAIFSYLNEKFFRLPTAIGIMAGALVTSLALFALGRAFPGSVGWAHSLLATIDFGDLLLDGMLSFLLFAGALHVDLGDLLERKWTVLALATVGVVLSTLIVGSAMWWIFGALGAGIPFPYALLFGALISPTDPIAVLGLLKEARVHRSLETIITGESLFNDGVGVVAYLLVMGLIAGGHEISFAWAAELFALEAGGGVLFGLAIGLAAFVLLRSVDNYKVEVLLTLSVVSGGYSLAGIIHVSGPIAMVVAGLFLGNHGRLFAMSQRTRDRLDDFWELVDEILNAILFLLVGLEILVIDLDWPHLRVGLAAVPIVLAARLASVGIPLAGVRLAEVPRKVALTAMTWGGLRGGISVALALAIPESPERSWILVATYIVVVFSILVQGLTLGSAVRLLVPPGTAGQDDRGPTPDPSRDERQNFRGQEGFADPRP